MMREPNAISVLIFDEKTSSPTELFYQELKNYGYNVAANVPVDTDIVAEAQKHKADLLLFNLQALSAELLFSLNELKQVDPKPVVIFSDQDAPDAIDSAVQAGVSAYVVGDLGSGRLNSVAQVALARFKEFQRLNTELEQAKCKLEERKLIEKAKGLLMKHQSVSEDIAFKRLRKSAMDKGQTMATAAQKVIDVLTMLDAN